MTISERIVQMLLNRSQRIFSMNEALLGFRSGGDDKKAGLCK